MSGSVIHNLPTDDQDHFRIQNNIPNSHDQTSTPINIVIEDHFRIQNNIPNGHDQISTPINIATDGQDQTWGWLRSMGIANLGTALVAVSFFAQKQCMEKQCVENGTLQWIVLIIYNAIIVTFVYVTPINIATDGQDQMWGSLPIVWKIFDVCSAILGIAMLMISLFSEKQFVENRTLQWIVLIIYNAITVTFVYVTPINIATWGSLPIVWKIFDVCFVILGIAMLAINPFSEKQFVENIISTTIIVTFTFMKHNFWGWLPIVWKIFDVCSAILGIAMLTISPFSEKQFVENRTLQCIVLIIITTIIVTFTFMKHNINTPINIATDGQDQMWGWLPIVWKILEVCSAILGMIFLAVSSFSEKQFVGNETLQCIVLIIVTAVLVTFIFVRRYINVFLRNLHFSMEVVIRCVFLLVVGGLTFLIKYPRFNIHSALIKSCNMPYGIQYNLFAVGAFSFLALLVSSESEQPVELGFFSLLLGLTIDASMEIPGKGSKFWYMSGATTFCMLLIILRQYMDSLGRSTRNNCVANLMSETWRRRLIKILKLFSAASGLFFLSICPFFKDQFGNDTEVLLFIIIFTLLVDHFISREPSFSTYIRSQCRKYRLMKAIMNSLFLMMTTGIMFLDKYPRFQIHLEHKESNCDDSEDIKGIKLPHGSHFNLYSVASFSFMALIISCEKEPQLVETGIFYFLLELTMDASIEILEEKIRNLWYILGAAIYCVVLIFLRTFLAPVETQGRIHSR